MSIALIRLERALPFTQQDVDSFNEKPHRLQAFAQGMLQAASTNNRFDRVTSDISNIVFWIGDTYSMGKCNITPITSTWVKEQYPGATHELFVTVMSNDNPDEVHVLIFYVP